MIADKLIPRLKDRFPDRPAKFGASPDPVAVFTAAHPEVGDIQIFDDGDEIILVAGKFTHGHFACYESKSVDEAELQIVEDVISFLDRLFADEVVLWGSYKGSGGWYKRNSDPSGIAHGPLYVWSGPTNSTAS